MLRGKLSGSITAEAALLIPIVNILLIAVLILSMMYHDRCVVRELAEQVIRSNSDTKSEEVIGQAIIAAAGNQLLGSRVTKAEVCIGITDITACVYMDNPWLDLIFLNSYDISVKVAGYKTKGVGIVRLFDVVINKINEIGW